MTYTKALLIALLLSLPFCAAADDSVVVDLPAIGNESPKKFCPVCKSEGKKSTIYKGFGMCTLLYCGGGHWDEDGTYHAAKPCNTCTYTYSCSNGHEWTESEPSW